MIASCAVDSPPVLIARAETGASEAALHLSEQLKQFVEHYSGPRLQLLAEEIMALVPSSPEEVHDQEMEPINNDTVRAALQFAALLPRSLPLPEVAPDPDGEISFDWIGQADRMFSVSIGASGSMAYAGRFGERSKTHGIEQLSDSLPQEILFGIEKTLR
jgi:hypothetical protein